MDTLTWYRWCINHVCMNDASIMYQPLSGSSKSIGIRMAFSYHISRSPIWYPLQCPTCKHMWCINHVWAIWYPLKRPTCTCKSDIISLCLSIWSFDLMAPVTCYVSCVCEWLRLTSHTWLTQTWHVSVTSYVSSLNYSLASMSSHNIRTFQEFACRRVQWREAVHRGCITSRPRCEKSHSSRPRTERFHSKWPFTTWQYRVIPGSRNHGFWPSQGVSKHTLMKSATQPASVVSINH